MKKLNKIFIKNFKSIQEVKLNLNSLNIFIGGNEDIETWLKNYSLDELLEKNILGGRPK